MNPTTSEWFTVVAYNPILNVCDLKPAAGSQRGFLSDVPIACWGGSWEQQKRQTPALPSVVDPGAWGAAARGPRWGVAYPVQLGDLAKVEYLGGSYNSPIITEFGGNPVEAGPAFVGAQLGESPFNRYDLLLPSGAWLKSLGDGSWLIATGPVGSPAASIRLGADGSVTINAASITINGVTTFNGTGQNINGKEIAVVGAPDSAGHPLTGSNQ